MNTVLTVIPTGELLVPTEYDERRIALKQDYAPLVEAATAITVITTPEGYERAVNIGRLMRQSVKNIDELYKPIKKQFDEAKKVILDHEREDSTAVKPVMDKLAAKCVAYQQEQERLRREIERAAQEEARKQEQERRLADAIEAEQRGEKAESVRILDEPSLPPPVIVQSVVPVKMKGQVTRTKWRARVDDFNKLIKGVADGKAPIQALSFNQGFLDTQADGFREGMNYPGVSTHPETKGSFKA